MNIFVDTYIFSMSEGVDEEKYDWSGTREQNKMRKASINVMANKQLDERYS